MIITGMLFLMMGMAMVNQMTLIGQKPKDKRLGWACQLLGVGLIYTGWMQSKMPLLDHIWNSTSQSLW